MAQAMLTKKDSTPIRAGLNIPPRESPDDSSLLQHLSVWFREGIQLPHQLAVQYASILLKQGIGSIEKLRRKLQRNPDYLMDINASITGNTANTASNSDVVVVFDVDDIEAIKTKLLTVVTTPQTPFETSTVPPNSLSSLSTGSNPTPKMIQQVDEHAKNTWQQSFQRLTQTANEKKRKLSEFQASPQSLSEENSTANVTSTTGTTGHNVATASSSRVATITEEFVNNPNISSYELITVEFPSTSYYYLLLLLFRDLSFNHRELELLRAINNSIPEHASALLERGLIRLLPSIFSVQRVNVRMIKELLTTFMKLLVTDRVLVLQQFVSNGGIEVLFEELFSLHHKTDTELVERLAEVANTIGLANSVYMNLIMNTTFIPNLVSILPQSNHKRTIVQNVLRLFVETIKENPSLIKVRKLFADFTLLPWLQVSFKRNDVGMIEYICQVLQVLASLRSSIITYFLTLSIAEELDSMVTAVKLEEKRLLHEVIVKTYRDVAAVIYAKRL